MNRENVVAAANKRRHNISAALESTNCYYFDERTMEDRTRLHDQITEILGRNVSYTMEFQITSEKIITEYLI